MPPDSAAPIPRQNSADLAAEWVSPAQLRPWAKNPRRNDGEPVERVADSIARFGFGAPIVARRETREVIAGHTRLKAALQLGLDRVPVRFLDLSDDDARTLALADNRLGELADWDDQNLADLLQDMDATEQQLAGFGPEDMRELLAQVATTGDLPDLNRPDPTHHQITFVLSARQLTIVERALAHAKAAGLQAVDNENSNGNALAAVCEAYCGQGEATPG